MTHCVNITRNKFQSFLYATNIIKFHGTLLVHFSLKNDVLFVFNKNEIKNNHYVSLCKNRILIVKTMILNTFTKTKSGLVLRMEFLY